VASLHILFNFDVKTDAILVAVLEVENSSEVKPTVWTRCLQGRQGTSRESVSVKLGVWSPGWYQAHKPCWAAELPHWCTASRCYSSASPGAVVTVACGQTVGWVYLPCSYWLPGAVGMASISSSQRGQKSKKQLFKAENQELGFLLLFMISSWLGVTHW